MAFFKFRKGGDEQSAAAPQPESVEVLRRRAKNRLIGATLLVAIGVIGFPLLVDRQPRPVAVDLPIDIPDKTRVQPLSVPTEPAVGSSAAVAGAVVEDTPVAPPVAAAPASAPAAKAPPVAKAVPAAPAVAGKVLPETKPESKPAARPEVKSEPKPAAKPEAKTEAKTEAKPDSRNPDGRYVVQVGSFADEGHARDARAKLERAGLKNYTQVADTKDGKRIRVRAGPFASKAEAERVAERIKKLDLPAALLTL